MFYDYFVLLCNQKGVSPSRAAVDAGISKSLVTKWKTNGTQIPSPEVLGKLSKYFDISVSQLIGEAELPAEKDRSIQDKDLMFALFGGSGEITDAMYEEVKAFARFVLQRETSKKETSG